MPKETSTSLKHKIGIKYTVDVMFLFAIMAITLFASAIFKADRNFALILTFVLVIYVIQYEFTKKWIDSSIKRTVDTTSDSAEQKTYYITTQEQKQKENIEKNLNIIKESSSTMENMKEYLVRNRDNSKVVITNIEQALDFTKEEQVAVKDNMEKMFNMKQKIQVIAELILELSEHTQQIGSTIGIVEDIAEQTNMLALNAAVEAARAGEHGKGFSVVAGEIRKLADKSKQATSKISTIIKDIQQATNSTVMATEEGSKELESSTKFANKIIGDVDRLIKLVSDINSSAKSIFDDTNSQTSISEELNTKYILLEEGLQNTLALVDENINNIKSISDISTSLKNEIANR
ncbi:hypothetical protein KBA27_04935 [bacterium]|nr:hypothetical protein [bacterium]